MSSAHAQLDVYRKNQFYTADRGTLLLMLYEGAIQFLRRAGEHLQRGEITEKGVCLSKAHSIVSELASTLDLETGGEIARKLGGLYNFVLDELMAAHLSNDIKPLEQALSILTTLNGAWERAVATARSEGLV